MRFSVLCVVGILSTLTTPVRAESPDPREVLQQAEAAIRALQAVRYEGQGEVEGMLANQIPRVSGTVTEQMPQGTDLPKLRLDVQLTSPRQPDAVHMELANDGKAITLVEHTQKVFIRRDLPGGMALLNNVTALLIRELTLPKPFEKETKATELKYVGAEKVGDVECDVIHAVFGNDGNETRWYFAKTDHLPRRVQRSMPTPMGKSTITTSLSKLDAAPVLKDDLFRLDKPAGFSEVSANGLLAVGAEAPDWTLKSSDGKDVALRDLRGKVVLLDFWATWCMPCRKAMPNVQKLYDKFKSRPVAIYGVDCLEKGTNADPMAVMKAGNFTYPILVNGTDVSRRYLVQSIPTFYLIGQDGKILLAQAGATDDMERQVEQLIEKALASQTPAAATP